STSWYGSGKRTLYKSCKRGTVFTYRLHGQVTYYAGKKYKVDNGYSPKMLAKCPRRELSNGCRGDARCTWPGHPTLRHGRRDDQAEEMCARTGIWLAMLSQQMSNPLGRGHSTSCEVGQK